MNTLIERWTYRQFAEETTAYSMYWTTGPLDPPHYGQCCRPVTTIYIVSWPTSVIPSQSYRSHRQADRQKRHVLRTRPWTIGPSRLRPMLQTSDHHFISYHGHHQSYRSHKQADRQNRHVLRTRPWTTGSMPQDPIQLNNNDFADSWPSSCSATVWYFLDYYFSKSFSFRNFLFIFN